jgi:hypothetical protein
LALVVFDALTNSGRRVIRLHLTGEQSEALPNLERVITQVLRRVKS